MGEKTERTFLNDEYLARKVKSDAIKNEASIDLSAAYLALLNNEDDPFRRLEILLGELIRITKDKAK
jgi:hypothetical protein